MKSTGPAEILAAGEGTDEIESTDECLSRIDGQKIDLMIALDPNDIIETLFNIRYAIDRSITAEARVIHY